MGNGMTFKFKLHLKFRLSFASYLQALRKRPAARRLVRRRRCVSQLGQHQL